MLRISAFVLAFSIPMLAATSMVGASSDPSSGAKGMPGAEGTFEFKPTDWMEGEKS